MTERQVYHAAVWLPLVVPAATGAGVLASGRGLAEHSAAVQLLVGSLLVGGLPYAAAAAWARRWMPRQPLARVRRLVWRAPLVVAVAYAAFALALGAALRSAFFGLAFLLGGLAAVLALGYAYVALVAAAVAVGHRAGWVAAGPSDPVAA